MLSSTLPIPALYKDNLRQSFISVDVICFLTGKKYADKLERFSQAQIVQTLWV